MVALTGGLLVRVGPTGTNAHPSVDDLTDAQGGGLAGSFSSGSAK